MAERLEQTLESTAPELVVLYAASVDARRATGPAGAWRSVDEIALEVGRLLDRVSDLRPEARTLLLGLIPETESRGDVPRRIMGLNQRLAALTRSRAGVRFVETTRPPLVEARLDEQRAPALVEDYSSDHIHLGSRGYRILEQWLLTEPWLGASETD